MQAQTMRDKLIQQGTIHPPIKVNPVNAKRTLSRVNAILARRALTKH